MSRLLNLATVLRAAGLPVVEVGGWTARGADTYGPVRGIIAHETRGSATSTDAGEVNVLVNGREGLSGPIAQLYLSRTGTWYVVASGTCHHVKTGWGGPHKGYGNDALLGIEAAHAQSEDWAHKPAQWASYVRGTAALALALDIPVGYVVGHKEHQPGDKPDPEFSMATFRTAVAARMEGGHTMEQPQINDLTAIASRLLAVVTLNPEFVNARVVPGGHLDSVPLIDAIKGIRADLDAVKKQLDAAPAPVITVTDEQLARVLHGVIFGDRP